MAKKPKIASKEVTTTDKKYDPTPKEREAVDNYFDRRGKVLHAPGLNVIECGDKTQIATNHPDQALGDILLMNALGTTDTAFYCGLLQQIANVGAKGQDPDESGLNFMLAMVKGFEPKDQVEAMLAAQMAAVHNATMTFARRLNHVENIAQQDSAERAFNKLARTFTAQLEALNRYRGKGQQKMTVEHVHVHEGGQAIVGNVQGGGSLKNSEATP